MIPMPIRDEMIHEAYNICKYHDMVSMIGFSYGICGGGASSGGGGSDDGAQQRCIIFYI